MATQPAYRLLTAKEFLEIEFGEQKAELDNGVIRMMAGGTARHSEVSVNILAFLRIALRGSGCRSYNSDMATQTRDDSVRYPDIAVFCGPADSFNDNAKAFNDPKVIFEILSEGTARTDLNVKVPEYQALPSVDTIVLVDIASERLRVWQRTPTNGWNDQPYAEPVNLDLPSLGITIPHNEIFARD